MGVCSSCLGHDRDRELSDEEEQSRLLFDDPHATHYGSFGDHSAASNTADPQEVQRETEALQKVVDQTSNHLIDIFPTNPQTISSPGPAAILPAHDARLIRYQDLLAKMSVSDPSTKSNHFPANGSSNVSDGWMSDEDDLEEMKAYKPVKSDGIGPLLGGFADAEAAMK